MSPSEWRKYKHDQSIDPFNCLYDYLSDIYWVWMAHMYICVCVTHVLEFGWHDCTLNSAYNEVAFNEKSAITKENPRTKYTLFTYNDVALNEKPPITKQNLCIFFFCYR